MSYRLLILAGTLLLQIYQLYGCHKRRNKKLQLLHKIFQIIPLSPTQIASKIAKIGPSQIIEICKGTVTAGEQTSSILDSNSNVIFSKLYGADIILGPSPKKRLLQTKEPSFLKIMDNQTTLNIYESHRSIVVPTKHITLSDPGSFLQKLKNKFKIIFTRPSGSTVNGLNYSLFGNDNIQQLYVPDPSECAILGKFRKEASQICCYQPMMISPSKERMVALIQQDLAGDQIHRVVLALVLTFSVGFLAKELWRLYQKHKSKTGSLLENLKKIFIKSRICNSCKTNLSCMLSQSCMHMATCQTCWQKNKQVCSECNKKVKGVVQIYVC